MINKMKVESIMKENRSKIVLENNEAGNNSIKYALT